LRNNNILGSYYNIRGKYIFLVGGSMGMAEEKRKWRDVPTDEDWWDSEVIPYIDDLPLGTKFLGEDRYRVSVSELPQEFRGVTSISQLEELLDWLKGHQQDAIYVEVHAEVNDDLPLAYIIEWTGNYMAFNDQRRGSQRPVLDFRAKVPSLDDLSDETIDTASANGVNIVKDFLPPTPYIMTKPVDPSRAEIVTEADWVKYIENILEKE